MLSGREQQQQQQQSFNDTYTALILEEAEKLYNGLATELTNRIIAANFIAISASPSLPLHNNRQKLTPSSEESEEARHNN
jgi:hypothetical protein